MAETDLWFGTLSATVRVEDLPASRQVVAIERQANGDWRVCGQAVSNAEGIATLPITGLPTSRIYAIAIDEWGKPFAPGMPVAYGDVIRPTQFLGWMYQVTSPGVLPGTEPEWWNSMAGVPQPVGTAMMQAVRHYQPIAHGPVSDIEWEEKEFDPYWDNVVALLHFDGSLTKNEAGPGFTTYGSPTLVPGEFSEALFADGSHGVLAQHDNFIFGSADFTIECLWKPVGINRSAFSFNAIGANAHTIYQSGSGLSFWNGGANIIVSNQIVASDRYHHIAFVRFGGMAHLFLEGVLIGSATYSNTLSNNGVRTGNVTPTNPAGGAIDELRITRGVARYTEDFTPPTAPFPNVGPPL